jgi:hypothetical protein
MNSGGHFRNWIWDPWLLSSQIIAMQSIFYASIALWLMVYDLLTGSTLTLEPIFDYDVRKRGFFIIFNFEEKLSLVFQK